jgi:hypothetical protein
MKGIHMNVIRIDMYLAVRKLREHWHIWDTLTRAEAVSQLLRSGLSIDTLADIAACSRATIRRLEVIAQLPDELKARIRAGEPSGKFVAWARAERLSRRLGISRAGTSVPYAPKRPSSLFLVRKSPLRLVTEGSVSNEPEN